MLRGSIFILFSVVFTFPIRAQPPEQALRAAKRATAFLTEQVSEQGGYLWSYSADLSQREGEGVVETKTVWVQPPGTPAVGEAFVRLFSATGDPQFLDAAKQAADVLRRGQMRSGGWQDRVELEPDRRRKWAYRIDPPSKKRKDQSSLDDDKTQSALRFLIQLDAALEFKDSVIHEMTRFGLNGLLRHGQFSGGGFPQVYTSTSKEALDVPAIAASYPEQWPRIYPGHGQYWYRYTLNDHLARDVVKVLILADRVYDDAIYRERLSRLADSLLLAQMPEPQPAWAQQYSQAMRPIWARKFEPPAITTSESFSVIETLMLVYAVTGDDQYLEPIPAALQYLQRCELTDGQVARFYELRTNRPLYMTRDYQLTYDDGDLPTHYGFKLSGKAQKLHRRYQKLVRLPAEQRLDSLDSGPKATESSVRAVIETLDDRGAWVSDRPMRFQKGSGPSIQMEQTVENLNLLAAYLERESLR